LGGVYGGGNYQINQVVLGVDGDYNWADLTGSASDLSPIPGNGSVSHHSDRMDWVSTVTGRLGYANTNWLIYGKGGWAWAGFSNNGFTTNAAGATTVFSSSAETRDGWTLGAGFEWAFNLHWSAKLEYDHVFFDTANYNDTSTNVATGGTGAFPRSTTSYLNLLKAGVAYKF
jgi:outer membrane immunogenic protein